MSVKARRIIFFGAIFLIVAGIVFLILMLVLHNLNNENNTPNDNKNYSLTVNSDNVAVDEKTGLSYVNNEILLTATKDSSREDIENIVSNYDGKIVGYIEAINQYRIQLGNIYSYTDLGKIENELDSFDKIKTTNKNHVVYIEFNNTPPNDSEWKNEWNDGIGGKNWGIEAIQAPEMWKLLESTNVSSVNVGVLDNQFYTEHEDLVFNGVEYNNYDDSLERSPSHGTHVSGTIAAVSNNAKGIAGVMLNDKGNKKVNLYGVSIEGIGIENKKSEEKNVIGITVSDYEAGFVDLIALKECKVINLSYGGGYGDEDEIIAKQIEDTLQVLIDEGNEFLIVKSAGNERVNYESCDLFSQFNNQNVLDRIITIGASKLCDGKIYLWEGSNYGEKVDIVAPGHNIHSTVCSRILWWLSSSYKDYTGTSMASPHVTGVAAAMWSVNPQLSGKEVKQLLCDTATGSYSYESYEQQSTVQIYDNEQKKTITHDINENKDFVNAYSYSYPMLNAKDAIIKVIESIDKDNNSDKSQPSPTQEPTQKPTNDLDDSSTQNENDVDFLIGDWSTSDNVYLSFYDDGVFVMDWGYFPEEEGNWSAEAISNDTIKIDMDGSSILSMMSMLYGNSLSDYHFEVLKCNDDNFYLVQVYGDYTARTSPCKLGFTREGAKRNFNLQ